MSDKDKLIKEQQELEKKYASLDEKAYTTSDKDMPNLITEQDAAYKRILEIQQEKKNAK